MLNHLLSPTQRERAHNKIVLLGILWLSHQVQLVGGLGATGVGVVKGIGQTKRRAGSVCMGSVCSVWLEMLNFVNKICATRLGRR